MDNGKLKERAVTGMFPVMANHEEWMIFMGPLEHFPRDTGEGEQARDNGGERKRSERE